MDFEVDVEVAEADKDNVELICWIRTRACKEMLKVDVCVMRKRVSMCLFSLPVNQHFTQ